MTIGTPVKLKAAMYGLPAGATGKILGVFRTLDRDSFVAAVEWDEARDVTGANLTEIRTDDLDYLSA